MNSATLSSLPELPLPPAPSLREALRVVPGAAGTGSEAGSELWHELLAGRYSLVDRFERDGRWYFVAKRSDPEIVVKLGLTRRERHVVTHIALGRSPKDVGGELGVSVATISGDQARAMRKLGVRSVAELAALFVPGQAEF
jgi:DNA-binding CsgD family transcriptional regulator